MNWYSDQVCPYQSNTHYSSRRKRENLKVLFVRFWFLLKALRAAGNFGSFLLSFENWKMQRVQFSVWCIASILNSRGLRLIILDQIFLKGNDKIIYLHLFIGVWIYVCVTNHWRPKILTPVLSLIKIVNLSTRSPRAKTTSPNKVHYRTSCRLKNTNLCKLRANKLFVHFLRNNKDWAVLDMFWRKVLK